MAVDEGRKKIRLHESTGEDRSTNDQPTSDVLKNDCLMEIFKHLPISDITRLQRVSKRWRLVCQQSLRKFTKLTFVNELWGCRNEQKVTQKALRKLLSHCGRNLQALDMSKTPILADNTDVSSLLKLCPNLTSVDFRSIKVGVPLIKSLVKHCKGIVRLKFGKATIRVTGRLINDTILKTLTSLEVLHLAGICFRKDHIDLKNCKSIRDLAFVYCSVCICNYKAIFLQIENLEILKLPGSLDICEQVPDLDFFKLPNLKELDITDNGWIVNDRFLIQIAGLFPGLTRLYVGDNALMTDEGLRAVLSSCNINLLSIYSPFHGSRITGACLSNVQSLKQLHCRCCTSLDPQFFQDLFENSVNLELLDLRDVDDEIVEGIIRVAKESVKTRDNGIDLNIWWSTRPI